MPSRPNALTYALFANAAAVTLLGVVWLARDGGPSLLPTAMAQQAPQPIAGGAGLFLMPGQLSQAAWGCYVMDVDRQTLMVYQYDPGRKYLNLTAARDFSNDRRLREFNTLPKPSEIKALTEAEAKPPANPKSFGPFDGWRLSIGKSAAATV